MITIPLRLLLVDNNPADVEIAIKNIEKIVEAPEIKVVNNFKDLASQLHEFFPDVIISDYNFPGLQDWMCWN